MKQKSSSYLILIYLFLGLLASIAWQEKQKEKTIILKETTVTIIDNTLKGVAEYLDKSNLPQQEVRQLQQALSTSYQTMHKDISDSTLNKK